LLLEKCLAGVLCQSRAVSAVYLIDNASTDGTEVMLERFGYLGPPGKHGGPREKLLEVGGETIRFVYIRAEQNRGGAWGFYQGIRAAFADGYDAFWIMDDDTVATSSAHGILCDAVSRVGNQAQLGFACSKVLWDEEQVHLMNIPNIETFVSSTPFNQLDAAGVMLVKSCSFVSVLILREAVAKAGFPIKEFFIWGDDTEYTSRLVSAGFRGIYVPGSVVQHLTKDNYSVDLFSDVAGNAWKYGYGIRNQLYLDKRKGLKKFLKSAYKQLVKINIKILRRRKVDRMTFVKVNTRAVLDAFFFKPSDDFLPL